MQQFIYRYLSAVDITTEEAVNDLIPRESPSYTKRTSDKVSDLTADEKTQLLISLVKDLHDCVNIMHNGSLMVSELDL